MDNFVVPADEAIDLHWAHSYVGMQMNVPEYWWDGCHGRQKYPGTIVEYNTPSGKWMLLLDDQDYRENYPMRWDTIPEFANDDRYTFFPFLPQTLPLSAEFDDTTNGIEQITEEMITKFNVNEDELPNNSRRRNGFQAFLLKFGSTLRNIDNELEKTEYIFPGNGDAIINGAMELETHARLVATLRKASQVWRNYTQNVRDAWKERAKLLNAVPVSGLLPSCPEMFLAFKGGVDGAVVTSLFHDWNCLCNFIRKSIQKR